MKKILFLILFLFASACYSQNTDRWLYLTSSNDGDFYLDTKTAYKKGSYLYVQIKGVFPNLVHLGRGIYYNKYTSRKCIDCALMKSKLISFYAYKDDLIVESFNDSNGSKWESFPPESVSEIILNKICEIYLGE